MTDIIDVRDLIKRLEELEEEQSNFEHDDDGNLNGATWADSYPDEASELASIASVLSDLKGYGGDEQWRGDWYPITLIRDSYFVDYAQELADDIGAIKRSLHWPYTCIDWDQAAKELQVDYSSVQYNGDTYWYR